MKYTLTLIGGVISIIAISLGAVIASKTADPDVRQLLYVLIVAMAGPAINTLLTLLRGEKNSEEIKQNTSLTESARRQAERAKAEAEALRLETLRAMGDAAAELKKKEEDLLHQLRGMRQAAALAHEESRLAIEEGRKAYSEANNVNRKLEEMRSEVAARETKTLEAVTGVDAKVIVVDEKVSDIQRHVDDPKPPGPSMQL